VATDQLGIYNGALMLCKERSLASLTEDREPRYLLDGVWARGGVRFCLEQGQWNFAMRTSILDYTSSVEPSFGYRRAFELPDDWVVPANVSSDEYFQEPLRDYQLEGRFLYCDLDSIYVRFVSDDDTYGFDYSLWPESFREFVEAYFASKVCRKISSRDIINDICDPKKGVLVLARKNAKNKDLQQEPTRFRAQGGWTKSRFGARSGRGPMGDGGSSGSLTG
jgi:hypothetical protein